MAFLTQLGFLLCKALTKLLTHQFTDIFVVQKMFEWQQSWGCVGLCAGHFGFSANDTFLFTAGGAENTAKSNWLPHCANSGSKKDSSTSLSKDNSCHQRELLWNPSKYEASCQAFILSRLTLKALSKTTSQHWRVHFVLTMHSRHNYKSHLTFSMIPHHCWGARTGGQRTWMTSGGVLWNKLYLSQRVEKQSEEQRVSHSLGTSEDLWHFMLLIPEGRTEMTH